MSVFIVCVLSENARNIEPIKPHHYIYLGTCIKQFHLRDIQYTIFRQTHSIPIWMYWDVVIILRWYGCGSRVGSPECSRPSGLRFFFQQCNLLFDITIWHVSLNLGWWKQIDAYVFGDTFSHNTFGALLLLSCYMGGVEHVYSHTRT